MNEAQGLPWSLEYNDSLIKSLLRQTSLCMAQSPNGMTCTLKFHSDLQPHQAQGPLSQRKWSRKLYVPVYEVWSDER